MTNKMVFLAAACLAGGGIAFVTSASALLLSPLRSDNGVEQVRMVCDEYGRCWRERTPAEDIVRGVIGGIEGRSVYRHRWHHYDRDWDGGRGYYRYYDDED